MSSKSIFWFRRDLRLIDNHGLFQALTQNKAVFPIFISLFKNLFARGVLTSDGAITLTLIFGDNSAANDLAKPSIAPLELDTLEWKGIPL